jgi:hypothetical protein
MIKIPPAPFLNEGRGDFELGIDAIAVLFIPGYCGPVNPRFVASEPPSVHDITLPPLVLGVAVNVPVEPFRA